VDKFIDLIDQLILRIVMGVIISIAVVVIVSVFLRYLFGISYVWLQELIVFLFIFSTFFGSALAYYRNEHLAIDIFYVKLPDKIKNILDIFFDILILYLNYQIIKVSFKWMERVGNVVTPGMRIPMSYIYFILPASAFLMIIYLLSNIYMKIKRSKFRSE